MLEETFDALVEALIASGALPQNAAAAMLEHLADRFIAHSRCETDTGWCIEPGELLDQAVRLKTQAARRGSSTTAQ